MSQILRRGFLGTAAVGGLAALTTGQLAAGTDAESKSIVFDELASLYKKRQGGSLELSKYDNVMLAISDWCGENKKEFSGFWNGQQSKNGNGQVVIGVVFIRTT